MDETDLDGTSSTWIRVNSLFAQNMTKEGNTAEPLKNGPLKSGQSLYNGHFVWNEPILLCFTLRLRLTE